MAYLPQPPPGRRGEPDGPCPGIEVAPPLTVQFDPAHGYVIGVDGDAVGCDEFWIQLLAVGSGGAAGRYGWKGVRPLAGGGWADVPGLAGGLDGSGYGAAREANAFAGLTAGLYVTATLDPDAGLVVFELESCS